MSLTRTPKYAGNSLVIRLSSYTRHTKVHAFLLFHTTLGPHKSEAWSVAVGDGNYVRSSHSQWGQLTHAAVLLFHYSVELPNLWIALKLIISMRAWEVDLRSFDLIPIALTTKLSLYPL